MAVLSHATATEAPEPMLCITILAHSGHEQQLCIPVAQVSAAPTEVMRQVETAGQSLVAKGETARITYVDEEGDACTLTPGTLSDALTFAEEGTAGNLSLTLLLSGECGTEPAQLPVEANPPAPEPIVQEAAQVAESAPETVEETHAALEIPAEVPAIPEQSAHQSVLDTETLRKNFEELKAACLEAPATPEQYPQLEAQRKKFEELKAAFAFASLDAATPEQNPQLETLQKNLEELQKELEAERSQREQLTEEANILKEREAQLQRGLEAQFARNEVLSDRAERLQDQCQDLVLEADELTKKMQNSVAEQEAKSQAAEEKIQSLEEREQHLQKELDGQVALTETLSERVGQLREQCTDLVAVADMLKEKMKGSTADLAASHERLSKAEERILDRTQQLKEFRSQLEAKEGENQKLKELTQQLQQSKKEELQAKAEENNELKALHQAVCAKLAKMRKQLNEVEGRETAQKKEKQELAERWSAEVASCSPLVLDLDADAEPSATGDATQRFTELLAATGGNKVFCFGRAHFPSDVGPASPASATITLQNVGEARWPSTTALVLAHGDGFGVPLQHVGPAAPGDKVEAVLDLLVPSSQDPGKAHSAWVLADAATGARLGPVLVFEALWEEPFM